MSKERGGKRGKGGRRERSGSEFSRRLNTWNFCFLIFSRILVCMLSALHHWKNENLVCLAGLWQQAATPSNETAMTMASDASTSSSSPPTSRQSTTTPILDELKRLQDIESFLSKLWQDEVHQYEQTTPSTSSTGVGGAGAGTDDDTIKCNCASRNHANSTGTIENKSLFPYHIALYPLLDCYDSFIEDKGYGVAYYPPTVVRPSPAPMLFDVDGHRRSQFSPRIDRYGVQIQEIETINEHLPNSAWAIQQSLMPHNRKLQFINYMTSDDRHQSSSTVHYYENRDFDRFRKDNYRFWNILLNPELEAYPILSDDNSVSSIESDEWEDSDDEEREYNETRRQARIRMKPDRLKDATYARDFRFLRWWRRTIVDERRGVIHFGMKEAGKDILALNNRYSPESLFADSTSSSSAICILLKVLKHSLSDLQRELRLAQAVVLLIADWKLCDNYKERSHEKGKDVASNQDNDSIDGIECLRLLLLIISSEYFPSCGGYCHERFLADAVLNEEDEPNHYCSDVSHDSKSWMNAFIVTICSKQPAFFESQVVGIPWLVLRTPLGRYFFHDTTTCQCYLRLRIP